jgi:osmotically-inducible protein OsmY
MRKVETQSPPQAAPKNLLLLGYLVVKSNLELKADVIAELTWDSAVKPKRVGVTVQHSVVTLTGQLDTVAEKHAVEPAVRRVAGVRGITMELDVKLLAEHERSDSDIAQAAAAALSWNSRIPDAKMQVKVENGWTTLTGEADWSCRAAQAVKCIHLLVGLRGLRNHISIGPRANPNDIGLEVAAALPRQATRDARRIGLGVQVNIVTLSDKVHSLGERDAVFGVALTAHGLTEVVDRLEVEF